MSDAPAPRALCEGCGRPPSVCWCGHAVQLRTRTRVVILQHPREARVAIGTVAIAARCLPEALVARGVVFEPARLEALLRGDPARPPVLLFPTDDARDLRADPFDGDVTLVMLDGTWTLARKLLARNPALAALPRVRFTPSRPSQYRIRREPAAHCVASIEALAEALTALERDPRYEALLPPFVAMIDHQLRCAAARGDAAPRRRTRPHGPQPTRRRAPPLAHLDPARVVLYYGEANAWPRGTEEAPDDELVHVVALRPATGERLELFARPTQALAPSFLRHAELTEAHLAGAVSREALAARWGDFVREGDALVTWGDYAADVAAREGLPTPSRTDLRAVVARSTHQRPGALEERCPDARTHPLGEGRAGRRLAALAHVYAALRG